MHLGEYLYVWAGRQIAQQIRGVQDVLTKLRHLGVDPQRQAVIHQTASLIGILKRNATPFDSTLITIYRPDQSPPTPEDYTSPSGDDADSSTSHGQFQDAEEKSTTSETSSDDTEDWETVDESGSEEGA